MRGRIRGWVVAAGRWSWCALPLLLVAAAQCGGGPGSGSGY
jgi:hypothetical protein